MNKRTKTILVNILLVLCIGLGVYVIQRPVVLELGVFTGSNWDVPSPQNGKIIDHAIALFEAEHPNVKVRYTSGIIKSDYSKWLSNKALSGDLPDVFMVMRDDLSTFADIGMLDDLNDDIQSDTTFDAKKYYSTSYETGNIGGHQFALPYESVPTLMFVNQTLINENHITIPKNWTWDDFYSICSQLTKDTDGDGVLDQFGQYGYTWQQALSSNGAHVFNEDGTKLLIEDQKAIDAIEFVRNLYRLNQGINVTSAMFDKGQVAFCPMRFSEYRTYKPYPWSVKKYSSFEWDCIPMPAGPKGANASEMDTLMFGMSKQSHHKRLAWDFLKTVSYEEKIQKQLFKYSQGVSVLKNITNSKTVQKYIQEDAPKDQNYNLDFFDETMEKAVVIHRFKEYDQVFPMIDSEMQRLLNTNEDIQKGISDTAEEVEITLGKK